MVTSQTLEISNFRLPHLKTFPDMNLIPLNLRKLKRASSKVLPMTYTLGQVGGIFFLEISLYPPYSSCYDKLEHSSLYCIKVYIPKRYIYLFSVTNTVFQKGIFR